MRQDRRAQRKGPAYVFVGEGELVVTPQLFRLVIKLNIDPVSQPRHIMQILVDICSQAIEKLVCFHRLNDVVEPLNLRAPNLLDLFRADIGYAFFCKILRSVDDLVQRRLYDGAEPP